MPETVEDRVRALEGAIDVLGEALKENPVSPKCAAILEKRPTKGECFDFRAVRARVNGLSVFS